MHKIKDVDDLRRVISVIGDGMKRGERSVVMLAPVYGGMVRNCDWSNAATLKKQKAALKFGFMRAWLRSTNIGMEYAAIFCNAI